MSDDETRRLLLESWNEGAQVMVQLMGVGIAALGGGEDVKKGDYGWSPAFDMVRKLRQRHDKMKLALERIAKEGDSQCEYVQDAMAAVKEEDAHA